MQQTMYRLIETGELFQKDDEYYEGFWVNAVTHLQRFPCWYPIPKADYGRPKSKWDYQGRRPIIAKGDY